MSSHTVRDLAICHTCGKIGNKRNMLELSGEYRHGRCYAEIMGDVDLLMLSREDLSRLTLEDIGADRMRLILERM